MRLPRCAESFQTAWTGQNSMSVQGRRRTSGSSGARTGELGRARLWVRARPVTLVVRPQPGHAVLPMCASALSDPGHDSPPWCTRRERNGRPRVSNCSCGVSASPSPSPHSPPTPTLGRTAPSAVAPPSRSDTFPSLLGFAFQAGSQTAAPAQWRGMRRCRVLASLNHGQLGPRQSRHPGRSGRTHAVANGVRSCLPMPRRSCVATRLGSERRPKWAGPNSRMQPSAHSQARAILTSPSCAPADAGRSASAVSP
jgi:hypothetical protein